MTIGRRLRTRREQLDMTLEDLSKIIGVSRQTLSRYETGVINTISSDRIESLAAALNTSPAYLMGWEPSLEDAGNAAVENRADILSEKDIRIARWFSSLPPETRKAILTLGGAPTELDE